MIQTIILFVVLGAAALYIGRRMWSTLRGAVAKDAGPGCGSNCGCSTPAAPAKGERPAARQSR
jgi:hypothetical protein